MKTLPVLIKKSEDIRKTKRGYYEYYGEDMGEKRNIEDVGVIGDISETKHRKEQCDDPNISMDPHDVSIEDILKRSDNTQED